MSRFRLYGSGGRPVYDSDGEPADRRLDRIKREFNAGVALFYDPEAGLVRTQVKIHRQSPEQFVATYQSGTDEDLLPPLFDRIEALAERRGWTIQHGLGGTQALYDALADGSAFDPDALAAVEGDLADRSIGPDDIREMAGDLGAVDLLVPDYDVAAATLAYVRETFEGYAVAISESTDVETIADADVAIRPTRSVDGVAPGPEFSAWLDRRQSAAATAALEDAVESAAEGFESASVPVATGVAGAVDRTGTASELGVRAVPPSAPAVTRRELRRTLSYGLPSGVAVGVVVGLMWSGVVGLESAPRWLLGAGSLLAALLWGGALLAVRIADDPDRLPDAPAAESESEPIEAALSRLAATADADTAREALASALGPYGVTIEPEGDRETQRRRAVGVGAAASALAGALAFAAAVVLPSSGLL
jgi:hypothetical protein